MEIIICDLIELCVGEIEGKVYTTVLLLITNCFIVLLKHFFTVQIHVAALQNTIYLIFVVKECCILLIKHLFLMCGY